MRVRVTAASNLILRPDAGTVIPRGRWSYCESQDRDFWVCLRGILAQPGDVSVQQHALRRGTDCLP